MNFERGVRTPLKYVSFSYPVRWRLTSQIQKETKAKMNLTAPLAISLSEPNVSYDVIVFARLSQILTSFVIQLVPKMPNKDRKVVAVSPTRMLTKSPVRLLEPSRS